MKLFTRFLIPTSLLLAACGGTETTPGNSTTTETSSTPSTSTTSAAGGAGTTSASGTTSSAITTSSTGVGGGACDPVGGGQGGAPNEEDPCGSVTAPGAPEARVAWVTKGDPKIDIHSAISLLWAFEYVVRVPPATAGDYTLEHERCSQPAGGTESCQTFDLPLPDPIPEGECGVDFAPKFGIDPSQYLPGTNHYSFAIRLVRGCQIVSQDAFDITVQYTP